jgi:hypothetical protein
VLQGLTATSRRVPWFSRAERARAAALLARLRLPGRGGRHIAELSGLLDLFWQEVDEIEAQARILHEV